MCGIVGYIGKKQAKNLLLNCLEKLEYRGYDSAGIAVSDNQKLKFLKTKGRVWDLKTICDNEDLEGFAGIAHTRWATHGEPSTVNSHPHFNADKTIAVVHNGIIENYEVLRKELMETGYQFKTDTDTEVIPHLIDYYYNGNILDAAVQTAKRLEGSYAAGILHQSEPDKIIAIKKDSPLIAGTSKTGTFIASDISAIIKETKDVYYMENNEFAVLKKDEIKFYNSKKEQIEKKLQKIEISQEAVEKAGFPHYMLKEIYEQPKAVENTLDGQISKDKPTKFGNIEKEQLAGIKKIYIVACGSAYHAGLIGKNAIEKLSGIEVEVNYASEFRYKNTTLNKDTLVVTVTQSGETADTLATIPIAKKKGAKTLAITNVAGSSVTREADMVFYTKAGPEIAVASTKAYLTQLTAMYIFAIFLGEITSFTSSAFLNHIKKELSEVVFCIKNTLELNNQIKSTFFTLVAEMIMRLQWRVH